MTFEHRLDVFVDDLEVRLQHFGSAAHTTNDVVAWIPEHRVLFTGDLVFNGGTPFVLMGSVSGSLLALDCITELDAAVIVPGHGDPCGPDVVDLAGAYLRFLQETAAEATSAGLTPLEAARQVDLGPFGRAPAPRAPGRQPAPRLRRVWRGPARGPPRRRRRPGRHGVLQRRPPPAVPGLTRMSRPQVPAACSPDDARRAPAPAIVRRAAAVVRSSTPTHRSVRTVVGKPAASASRTVARTQ